MADIGHQVTISRRVTEVFQAVTAYGEDKAIQQWQRAISSIGVTAGNPLRAGSMIALRKNFIASEIFVNMDVIDLQRNKRIEFKGIHGRFPFTRAIEFAPQGSETTITDSINIQTGLLFFLWRPIMVNALKSQTAREWRLLKQQLEQG